MMLVGGMLALATLLTFFFKVPTISIDAAEKQTYANVMRIDIADLNDVDSLTPYEALRYSMYAKNRAKIVHY